MYLSKIKLDTNRYETRRALASPQILHAAVENCFSEPADGKERKLWRLDMLRGNPYLLLLSPQRPSFTRFCNEFCVSGVTGETKNYDNLLMRIAEGQEWNFMIRGNTTHSMPSGEEGKRGKLCSHVSVRYQREWLMKKALSCGFELKEDMFEITQTDQLKFWRNKQEQPVILAVAVFEGALVIKDIELFKRTLTNGIGRAKAYGCGLLTIARGK
jgi:CRISPR system Cascade subunit CasE